MPDALPVGPGTLGTCGDSSLMSLDESLCQPESFLNQLLPIPVTPARAATVRGVVARLAIAVTKPVLFPAIVTVMTSSFCSSATND